MVSRVREWARTPWRPAVPLLFFTLVALLSQIPVVAMGKSLSPSYYVAHLTGTGGGARPFIDSAAGYLQQSLNHYFASSLVLHHSLWWNPFVGLGAPLAQSLQPSAFYPVTLLAHLLHWESTGIDVANLINMVIAGYGTWLLAQRLRIPAMAALLSGAIFMLSGSFVWFGTLFSDTVAWLPWVVYFALRLLQPELSDSRPLLGLAVAAFLEAVGGFPDVPFLGVIFLLLPMLVTYTIAERTPLQRMFLVMEGLGLGVLGSAFLLVPFVYDLKYNLVWNGVKTASVFLPVHADLIWFIPFAFDRWFSPPLSIANWYTIGGYIGTLPAVLALGAAFAALRNRSWMFLVLAGIAVLAALQANGLGVAPLVAHLPVLDLLPLSRLSIIVISLAVALLAGYGVGSGFAFIPWAGLAAFLTFGLLIYKDHALFTSVLARASIFLALALVALLVVVSLLWKRQPQRLLLAAAGLAILELLTWSNVNLLHLPPRSPVWRAPAYISYLQRHASNYRVVSLAGRLRPGYGADFGLREIWDEAATMPKNFAQFIRTTMDPKAPLPAFIGFSAGSSLTTTIPLLEFLGVHYIIAPTGYVVPPTLTAVYKDPAADTIVYALPGNSQLLWWPSRVVAGSSMPSQGVQTTAEVPKTVPGGLRGRVNVRRAQLGNGTVDLSTLNSTRRLVVIRDNFYPGWSATVNGSPAPIVPVDGIFQGIWVPAGQSQVIVHYSPPGLPEGLVLSFLAVMWMMVRIFRRPKQLVGSGAAAPVEGGPV